MPRPRQPKLIRTVPSTVRAAKPAAAAEYDRQETSVTTRAQDSGRVGSENDGTKVRETISPRKDGTAKRPKGRPTRALTVSTRGSTNSSMESPKSLKSSGLLSMTALPGKENVPPLEGRRKLQEPAAPTEQIQLPDQRKGRQPTRASDIHSTQRPSSLLRQQNTPLGRSSILGRMHFKKRIRQPSLLQVAQSQQNTSVELGDLDIDEFRPDDESTPLIKAMKNPGQRTSSSDSKTSRKRKLASPEIQVSASQDYSGRPESTGESSLDLRSSPEITSEEEDGPESLLPRLPRPETRSPTVLSETHALPQSSSSPGRGPLGECLNKSLESSEQVSAHVPSDGVLSPRRTKTPAARSRKPPRSPVPLTTARLQNLLPRRRKRRGKQETYNVPSSSDVELDATRLGEDEDELSFQATNKMRQRKSVMPIKSKRASRVGTNKSKEGASGTKRKSATYSKRDEIDSQAEHDEDSSLQFDTSTLEIDGKTLPVLDPQTKAEMKRLADKFREVDDFTLDFEDVTGSSSQMKDAR